MPTVQVQHRIRKKNGEWGKPTPAALITEEIAHLPEEADTQILSLLLGAADPQLIGLQYVNVATRASFRIPEPLLERVLPLMAQSGRLYRRDEGNALTPLDWDGGPPWVFRLDVTILPDERVAVDGVLQREGIDTRRIGHFAAALAGVRCRARHRRPARSSRRAFVAARAARDRDEPSSRNRPRRH